MGGIRKTLTLLFGAPPSPPPMSGDSPIGGGSPIFVLLPDSWVRPRKPIPRVEGTDDIDWALAIALAITEWYGGQPRPPLPRRGRYSGFVEVA